MGVIATGCTDKLNRANMFILIFKDFEILRFWHIVDVERFVDMDNFGGVIKRNIDVMADDDDAYCFVE